MWQEIHSTTQPNGPCGTWKVITTITWISAASCWSFFILQCDGGGRMSTLTLDWVIILLIGAQVMNCKLRIRELGNQKVWE